jgi:hypothetical protein
MPLSPSVAPVRVNRRKAVWRRPARWVDAPVGGLRHAPPRLNTAAGAGHLPVAGAAHDSTTCVLPPRFGDADDRICLLCT